MRKLVHLLLFTIICFAANFTNAQTIDLELELESSNPVFPIFTASDFTLILHNNSPTDATGIVVNFPVLEQKTTRVSGTNDIVSHGVYDIFSGIWEVGTLPAGARATVRTRLYAQTEAIELFAQVVSARQEDEDSTPNNGMCCDAVEDDEVVFSNVNFLHKFVYCPEDIVVTVPRGTAGTQVYYADAIFESECEVATTVEQLRPEGLPSGSFFPVGFTGALYQASNALCGEHLCAFNIIVQERDATVDLELTAISDNPIVGRYERAQYTIQVHNNSDTDATGVKVQLDIPDNIKQVGNFRPITSAGRYIPFYRLWEVGELAAGASETLEIAIFTLEEGATALAQVIATEQADADSFPSSANCCEVNEDDEVLLNAPSNQSNIPMTTRVATHHYTAFPNPANAVLHLTFWSEAEQINWRIVDVHGRLIRTAQWVETSGFQERSLDVGRLSSGIYFLQLQVGNEQKNLRFVKG